MATIRPKIGRLRGRAASVAVALTALACAQVARGQQPAPRLPGANQASSPPTIAAGCRHATFAATVVQGREYAHSLPGDLEFDLLPIRYAPPSGSEASSATGWSIFIGARGNRTENYVGIATPPYHGVNDADIDAWHFRNADNTGPNNGQVNAPGKVRHFSFVLNEAQYKKFFDALNITMHEPNATSEQRVEAENSISRGARQTG